MTFTLPARFRVALLAAAVALPGASHALGLGGVLGEAVLGESLRLEVPLIGSLDRPFDLECITLHRPPDSLDADYFPRDIVARMDRQDGTSRLVLSTRSAIRQPIVEFRVAMGCGYNLSHDYLLLASPREERTQPQPAPVSADSAPTMVARTAVSSKPKAAVPGGRKDRLMVGAGGSVRDLKETMVLVERLAGVMERQVEAQATNNEKVQQLEATVAELGKYVARLEADARDRDARWQAERQAEKVAHDTVAERGWWQLVLAVIVGGMLGAGLLQTARLLVRSSDE